MRQQLHNLIQRYRRQLNSYESAPAYALLGVVGGIASGLMVLAFETIINELTGFWALGNSPGDFESLPQWLRFALPAGGAVVLACVYAALKPEDRETGIVHVLSRMHSHYSVLPLRNALLQFFGGAFALATGQSGGREGPGIHLGGAVNSLLGQWLHLPNNSLRILIACGTAGGIAAAFKTPLAGVIFAMEVIIVEYTVVGFIPVILAAVAASAVSLTLSSNSGLMDLPPLELNSLLELPFIVLLGFCCGVAVALFIRISKFTAGFSHWPVVVRFTLAGVLTGLLALRVPEILGIGYDTLNLALSGQLTITFLLVMAACKTLATAVTSGVGMPVGVIGPNLLIGASIGGVLGMIGTALQPELASNPILYIVIGMGAAMGAVLNAPLAALLAIIELTHSLEISMAAMLAIVTATLTNTGLFGHLSAHQMVLQHLRRPVRNDPLNQLLHRTSVSSTMDTRVMRVPAKLQTHDLSPLLEHTPTWCLVEREGDDLYLVRGADLLAWISATEASADTWDVTESDIRRWTIASVPMQATLRQALDAMHEKTTEAICVLERSRNTGKNILHGVVTRESIEKFSLRSLET